jgi:hypothetical protein
MTTSTQIAEDAVRGFRTAILASTDWAVLPDTALTDAIKTKYEGYRQYLRDLPSNMSEDEVNSFNESDILDFDAWVTAQG